MRKLVGKLDNTHKELVSEVTKKGGLSLMASGISELSGVDKENVKNHPYYQMFDKMTDGQIYLGDYLKDEIYRRCKKG